MLIHKRTMGVLDLYWTGQYRTGPEGRREPEMREFSMKDVSDPEEWWILPRGSALGRKARRVYPFCTAVTDGDGGLADILPLGAPPAGRRTPQKRTRQRRMRTGLLEFILKERVET